MKGTRLAVALLMSMLSFSTAGAQEDGGTGFESGCGVFAICSGGHKVNGPSVGGLKYPHQACMICISEGGCHPGCDDVLGPDVRPFYLDMLRAANGLDAKALVALDSKAPGYVTFNSARNSIQVLSCNQRTVIANVPLRGPQAVALAARLLPASGGTLTIAER